MSKKTIQVNGFLSNVSAAEVTTFLEGYTGKATVFALKIRQQRNGAKAYAIVQFNESSDAERIIRLANHGLYYRSSYLKARQMEKDIVQKPRTFLHTMELITVHFGCQVSDEKFYDLWNSDDVTVKFGAGMRKLLFLLSHCGSEYKLELFYENIWQIELHRAYNRTSKHLLIQLFGAPRIYEKEVRSSGLVFDDPLFNYFMDAPDDQWVRTTDFTRSYCIGQSSALCLELPHNLELPNFQENFAYYKENEGRLVLESGCSYSCNLTLVPSVRPRLGVNLPFEILFKVNLLVQNGCIPGPALDDTFYRLVDPSRMEKVYIDYALEKLYYRKECCYEPLRWLFEEYRVYTRSTIHPVSPAISLDYGLVYVRRVQITPSRIYFVGPEINVSNRVLREFRNDIDNFLRISFVDEELDKIHSMNVQARGRRTGIYERILSTLRNGIVIGDKRFDFLAFSSSQLRENSAWMFASRMGLSAADIRSWMGNFSRIRNVAKYAARLGQSFSSSTETLSVNKDEINHIPDIEVVTDQNKFVFSDGIGKISGEFAKRVAAKCHLNGTVPSAFQIRIGGFKGVVAVDPTSPWKLSLRKSMEKYESESTKLDVLTWTKYQPCFLNRQLITLLSTLGVPDCAFERKQREVVDQLNALLTDPLKAQEALELMSPGENTNILKEMLQCGYKPDEEPFLSMMLQTFRASKLLELRTKTRIFIKNGRSMMGCLDETRTLNYGQVFVQFSGSRPGQRFLVQDKVVVAKNPCLHPGDVRVLSAIDVPDLYHLVDCIVFPQKGTRPHPNECSGSDLDGDIYFVCWDTDLIPPKQIEPMDYSPAPSVTLDHEVTIEEVEEYFTNYIVNDSLGIISNAHVAFADREPGKAMSHSCLELAKLHSIAVDFPKTGVPAEIPQELRVKEYPDFMEKPDKPSYQSHRVIGKLFREVKSLAPNECSINSLTQDKMKRFYDPDMEVDGFEDYIDDAFFHKSNYDYKLGNLMDYYGIKTEAEILSGCVMKMARSFTKRRDAEAVNMAVRSLKKEARSWFNEKRSGSDDEIDDAYAKASAWYYVTYHPSYFGQYNEGMNRDHFLSFAWCVYDKLIQTKKEIASIRRALDMSSLESRFRRGLGLD
ncbi:RNA-dependent RNA polymerase 1 [Hibiscus syriacus]|uniref:RNA-dependent RNA polymerase n=1 Tax=Hibiscus syriacus TaxID=106335 RepID=A0A6A2XCM6_HIBSY|nr:RNA-dependent RNA polymerase 1-like [Hibiscus syriacus]KAE8667250.1 RNA-dependent RNA polymerase 1 [Hibiscus syriacus]